MRTEQQLATGHPWRATHGEFTWERSFTSERKPNGVRAALLARGHLVDFEATSCGSIHRSLEDGAAFGGEAWLARRRRRWRTTAHRGGGACARLCSALGLLGRRAAKANVSPSRTDPRRRRRRGISVRRHLATMRRAGHAAIPRVRSTAGATTWRLEKCRLRFEGTQRKQWVDS